MLVNVDPLNPANAPDPQDVRAAGFGGVRLVSRHGVEEYIDVCWRINLYVLAVVTEQSGGYLCPADCYQVGNEPDVAGTNDSMSPAAYREYWRLYRETYPDMPMITAGLASGQVAYWKAVGTLKGMSGFALHPYGKNWWEARALIRNYLMITPEHPVWVTEWNRPAAEVPEFAAMLRAETVMSAWFSWGWQEWALGDAHRRALAAVA